MNKKEKKRKSGKKSKTKILWVKQTSFLTPTLKLLGSFSHMATCRSSSKNTRKMNLKPILNKNFTTSSYRVGI
jgi:hypothetical protein